MYAKRRRPVCDGPMGCHNSGFTKDFDRTVGWLASSLSKSRVSELIRIVWQTVGRRISRILDDIEDSTDGRRLRIHDAKAVYGRLLIQFCAQILRTELRLMADGFRKETRKCAATPDKTLIRLRSLTKIKYADKRGNQYVTLLEGQRLILEDIGIKLDFASDVYSADTEALVDSGQN